MQETSTTTVVSKYTSLSDWKEENPDAYRAAKRKKLLEELCRMFGWVFQRKGVWTKENCIEDAKKYVTRLEWQRAPGAGYFTAQQNGWLNECCAHMGIGRTNSVVYLTLEMCKADALKYLSPYRWQKRSIRAYQTAHDNNWLDECCAHMRGRNKPGGYWTLETCKADALKFSTLKEWREGSTKAYESAKKRRWLNECTAHMPRRRTKNKTEV